MDLSRNTEALLTMWPYTSDRGAPWEEKLTESESEFWWLGAFLNFPLGLRVAVLFVSQQHCSTSVSSYALMESAQL